MKSTAENNAVANLRTLLAGEVAERQALERELRARERRFETFFAAAPVGLAVLDNSLRYVQVNDALARINGVSAEAHRGKSIHEIVPADVAADMETTLREVLRTREPVLNLEVVGEAPDEPGRQHKWLLSFVPLVGGDDQALGVSALVFDITDQAQTEQALQEQAAKYRLLLEHSSDAIMVTDDAGHILDVNPKAYRLLGYTRVELLRLTVRDLISEEDLAERPIAYDELRAGKVMRRRRKMRRKDGTLVAVEVVGVMIAPGKIQSVIRVADEAPPVANKPAHGTLIAGQKALPQQMLKNLVVALSAAVEVLEQGQQPAPTPAVDLSGGIEFYDEVSRFETGLIERALQMAHGSQRKAAELLGINHTTLHTMLKRYQIDLDKFKPKPARKHAAVGDKRKR
jgi:PAS domain S-box-containing protein